MTDHDHNEDNLSEGQSQEMMRLVFDHYLNHHKAVFKKLYHAKNATRKSYKELSSLAGNLRTSKAPPEALTQAHHYDAMWGNILDLFRDHGATEGELDAIDEILTDIPRQIKKHYDLLIEQDRILKGLIAKLHTPEYKKALSLIEEVQQEHQPVSLKDAYFADEEITSSSASYKLDSPHSSAS